MLLLLSVCEFEYITDSEWLKPIKFDRLVGNTASQMSRPLVEPYKASEVFGS